MTTACVFFNAKSGTAQHMGLTARFLEKTLERHGIDAEVLAPGEGMSFDEVLEQARDTRADVLIAAGGDGTITAMAKIGIETGKPLAILPLGTANLLARDLAIPLEHTHWLESFAAMEPRRIDVGEVNGTLFLHTVVIGLMPGIASAREYVRSHGGPLAGLAFMRFIIRRMERFRRMRVGVSVDGGPMRRTKVSAIAVANNAYGEGLGQVLHRERLDGGKLSLYVAPRLTLVESLQLLAGMLVGSWRHEGPIDAMEADTVTLVRSRRHTKAMVDGDPVTLEMPLKVRIRPGALTVLAPPRQENAGPLGLVAGLVQG